MNWRTSGSEVDKEIYREYRKTAKISVTKPKALAYEDMYDKLNTKKGQTLNIQVGKYQEKESSRHNRQHMNDSRGNTLTEDGDIRNRWSGYYSSLLL